MELNKYIETFEDCKDTLLKSFRGEVEKTFSTGMSELDTILKLQTKRLMVITGMSGRGKTFLTNNILFNTYKLHGWKHLICSLEGETTDMFDELAQMETQKSIYSNNCRMSENDFVNAREKLSNHFIRFKTDRFWKVNQIIEIAKECIRQYGIKTITIDPYNKIDTKVTGREDKDIETMLNKLLAFAKEYGVLVIFVAHPTTGSSREKNYIPTLYDVSGGGAWMNMCDYGLSVHRFLDKNKKKRNQTKVVIHKVKSKSIGDPSGGEIYLEYGYRTHRLENIKGEKYDKDWEEPSTKEIFKNKKGGV